MANRAIHQKTSFKVGDTVRVHQLIQEGDKERTQVFEGVVIAIKANGDPTFTVRKLAAHQIAVEKIFPLHAPVVKKLEVVRRGQVKRAKLYYLRQRSGRHATKTKEARNNSR